MLQVPGSSKKSRGRSPSPSDHHRHRSQSRKQSPSRERHRSRSATRDRSSTRYRAADYLNDYSRESTSHRAPKTGYDYDYQEGDGKYRSGYQSESQRGRRPAQDQYYLSDQVPTTPRFSRSSTRDGWADPRAENQASDHNRRSSSRLRPEPVSKYTDYSDFYTDSDDEGLAYGDIYYVSSSERSRSRDRSRNPSRRPHDRNLLSDESREPRAYARDPSLKYQESRPSRNESQRDSYYSGAAGAFTAKLQEAKSYFTGRPQKNESGLNEDEWAEIPECERPGFIPPDERSQMPRSAAAPATSGYGYMHPYPNATSRDEQNAPYQAPKYPTIPASQYVPSDQYTKGNNAAQKPSAPSQLVSPEHYLNMFNKGQPLQMSGGPPRTSGHHRASSTGNIPTISQGQQATVPQVHFAQAESNSKVPSKSTKQEIPIVYPSYAEKPVDHMKSGFIEIPAERVHAARKHSRSVSAVNDKMKVPMPGGFPDPNHRAPSPMLEPYHGTYQTISPIPWPTTSAELDGDLSEFELDDDGSKPLYIKTMRNKDDFERLERYQKMSKDLTWTSKEVMGYDPKADVKAIKSALSHTKIDPRPLMEILPYLTPDELVVLEDEYKNHVKMSGHGVNLAKHIAFKMSGNLKKACHATTLGQWGSEAYWANFWYRKNSSRRELLIESLMGRPNDDIRLIKSCFRDKRYGDNLERCMKSELKADKFRSAVLLALEERRQNDFAPLNADLARRDVQDLHRALIAREGGETAMIQILLIRGNSHLPEVLRMYEATFKQQFPRLLMAKSKNLVGEMLLHIVNGAINRALRDALLIHHAIAETSRDRPDLLISRLVRMHWEPTHLENVKWEYKRRYKHSIETHILEKIVKDTSAGKADWAEYCIELVKSSRTHLAKEGAQH